MNRPLRDEHRREYFDATMEPADRARELDDIDRLNAWFGGYAVVLREIRGVAREVPAKRPILVADVGGGRADFAVRLVRWARKQGRMIRVMVLDSGADVLGMAREATKAYPEIVLVRAKATELPLREGAVDVVTTSLMLHHLGPDEVMASLAEMRSAARRRVVANDLLRTWASLVLVWLVTRLFARTPMARHDGPLSVRRAYAEDELRLLAEKAGIQRFAIRRYPLLARIVAVGR